MSGGLEKRLNLFVSDVLCYELYCLGSQCLRKTEECYLNALCYELYFLGLSYTVPDNAFYRITIRYLMQLFASNSLRLHGAG